MKAGTKCDPTDTQTGMSRQWTEGENYGFISPSGGEGVFCHITDIRDKQVNTLKGDECTFQVVSDERKGKNKA